VIKGMDDRIKRSRDAINKVASPPKFGGGKKSAKDLERENCPRRTRIRINNLRSEWSKRKNKCMDFIDSLADAMEKKVKDTVGLLGVDSDEAEGVDITKVVKYEFGDEEKNK